jgi:hypothetical protein
MRENINIKDFSDKLLDEEFGLAYLPDEIRWQRLGISKNGNSITNMMDNLPTTSKV